MSQRCPRDQDHVPLVGGRAAAAAIHPHKLCCAICKGLAAQIRADEGLRIDTPLLDSNGLRNFRQAYQEATGPDLNSLFFDPTISLDTDMPIRSLHTVFADCSSTPPSPDSPTILQSRRELLSMAYPQTKVHLNVMKMEVGGGRNQKADSPAND